METPNQQIVPKSKIADFAIVSLIIGLLSPFSFLIDEPTIQSGLLGIIAIIFGVLAIVRIKKEHLRGIELAGIGITLGLLEIGSIFLLVFIAAGIMSSGLGM